MEAEFFVGATPPDKQAQLKKAVADAAAAKVSADRAKIVVDFASDVLPPVAEDPVDPDDGISIMGAPEGISGALNAMRQMSRMEDGQNAVDAWKARQNAPQKIILPGQEFPEDNEITIENEILDEDDPTFLLQQQLGLLPGVSKTRANKMAKGARAGMHNLTIEAQRAHKMAEKKRRRALMEQLKKGRKK
ncbi:MAG TPA: hypothetical protein VFH61_12215 [Thermoleophilia bacterium]|nr:hypothetical protein [Thermoleophilia bacterium]